MMEGKRMEVLNNNTRIWILDDNRNEIASIDFPKVGDRTFNIHSVEVAPEYRDQGIGEDLLERAYNFLKENKRNAIVTCSFAKKWFDEHPEHKDICQK